jgi:hypothetical protein
MRKRGSALAPGDDHLVGEPGEIVQSAFAPRFRCIEVASPDEALAIRLEDAYQADRCVADPGCQAGQPVKLAGDLGPIDRGEAKMARRPASQASEDQAAFSPAPFR